MVNIHEQNIFLAGQPSALPGLSGRLHSILQSLLPPGSQITIQLAADPALDAWKGMAAFSRSEEFRNAQCAVTRAQYDEFGGERIRKWWGGNWNGVGIPVGEGKETEDSMDVDS